MNPRRRARTSTRRERRRKCQHTRPGGGGGGGGGILGGGPARARDDVRAAALAGDHVPGRGVAGGGVRVGVRAAAAEARPHHLEGCVCKGVLCGRVEGD
jgi:hypothetical protein